MNSIRRSFASRFLTFPLASSWLMTLVFLLSVNRAPADYETWNGSTSSDWDTATNWTGRFAQNNVGMVPTPGNAAYFSQASPNMQVTFSVANNMPDQLFFNGNGGGYTLGAVGNTTDGLSFNDYAGVYIQSTLTSTNTPETINAPITGLGRLFLTNYSPAVSTPSLASSQVNGYGNALNLAGPISDSSNQSIRFMGMGNINVTGNITEANGGGVFSDIVGAGTVTLSGTSNSWTGNTTVGGNMVLDYTGSPTASQGFSPNASFQIGNTYANYSGNVPASGGSLVIKGNQAGTTLVMGSAGVDGNGNHIAIGGTQLSGSNSVLIEGGTNSAAPTNVYLGNITNGTNGGATDISTTGNVNLYTNSTNNGLYGSDINLIGQYLTLNKTYWAQSNGNKVAYQYTDGSYSPYLPSLTPLLITPLTQDDGTDFSSKWNNYHVANEGAADVQVLSGQNEGADTIRFTSANDPGGFDVTSAHTLDLNGGTLNMVYSGLMVTQAVQGDTFVKNGSMTGGLDGFSIINYSSGTLHISANIGAQAIGIDGGGSVELSGNNEMDDNGNQANGQPISINSGKLILGSATALGTGNQLDFGSATAVLDMNGQSASVSRVLSDGDFVPGDVAAAAGLNSDIVNSAGGTISTLTVEGNGQGNNDDGNVHTTDLYGDNNLGGYLGGFNESSGAILSLDIEKGADSNQVEFILGTSNPIGDQTGADSNNIAGIEGASMELTGAIIVGKGANLGLVGYGHVETLGVTDLNGNFGSDGQQVNSYGTTYLAGNGAFVPGYQGNWGFDLNHVGSVADTFTGTFGTAAYNANMNFLSAGTGTVIFANALYGQGITSVGTSHTIAPAAANGATVSAYDRSSVTLTANTGTVAGNLNLGNGGTIDIAPVGSGQNVVVTSTGNHLGGNNGTLLLDAGSNSSVTYQMGNGGALNLDGNIDGSYTVGAVQGLTSLGTKDRFVALTGGQSIYGENGIAFGSNPNQILGTSYYAQDDSAGSPKNATFLTYSGTGTASDRGFVGYTYDAAHTNNVQAGAETDVELVTAGTTYNYTRGDFNPLFGLQVDKGATVNVTGNLTMGEFDYTGFAGIILNGGSITGNGVNLYRATSFYTDLDNGNISKIGVSGQNMEINGPGTLTVGSFTNLGNTRINDGALDLGESIVTQSGTIVLNGGVLQGNGDFARTIGTGNNQLVWNSGGFAARGGELDVDINNDNTLVWGAGGTANFLGQGNVMQFGSNTSDSDVVFNNNIDLGVPNSNNIGGSAIYSRVINVTSNDPAGLGFGNDYVVMTGAISGSDPYEGLAKDGNGVLILAGANTYTGATTIAAGKLGIGNDSNLGTAPTAAYALNVAPGVSGAALTPGAVEINGGATLLDYYILTLNANRQLLLASGTTGANASIVEVEGDSTDGYNTMSFGGTIADYVNEVGSLEKRGGGTFDYSGTSANTGSLAVTGGTFAVTGAGNVNSMSHVVVNNAVATGDNAKFNYASTAVGLTKTVTYGSGGGTFAYNSSHAYSGATALTVGAKDTLSGGGNLGGTALTIASGGTLLPGDVDVASGTASTGMLTAGGVTLLSGGNYNFLLADAAGAAGVGYSSVAASSVDLSGLLPTAKFSINMESLANGASGDAVNFDPSQAYAFTLFSTAPGEITPETQAQLNAEFAVYTMPSDGATGMTNAANGDWEVVESADGSTLSLSYTPTAAPEPSVWAMMAGGVGLLVFALRLKRRSV